MIQSCITHSDNLKAEMFMGNILTHEYHLKQIPISIKPPGMAQLN